MRLAATAIALVVVLSTAPAAAQTGGTPQPTAAQPPTAAAPLREPEAIAALERMGAHLRTLTSFAIAGDVTSEEVLETGQSISFTGAIDLVAQRPNRLRANLDSSRKRRQYFYDGRTLTIWAPRQGFYSTVEAPATIHEMLNTASDRLDLVLPLHDMFQFGVSPELTSRVTSGFFVGVEAVDDQKCEHYAFRQPDVDWEIWIREGEQPLPCMYRITNLADPSRPDYIVRLDWDTAPEITDETFTFVAPEGADRIPVALARTGRSPQ
jgi:hypothetical protein